MLLTFRQKKRKSKLKRYLIFLIILVTLNSQAQENSLQEKDIDVYGFNIHYVEIGSGPTLILLHGLWGGTNEWMPIIKPLASSTMVLNVYTER